MKIRINNHWKFTMLRTGAFLYLLLFSVLAFGQINVSGTVTASNTGETLIGANIQIKNSTVGVVTDIDGTYEIQIPDANSILVVSYIGYQTAEILVNGRSTIDIVMELDAGLLEEVVVIGYGAQRKGDLTGAVATVKGDDLAKLPTSSVEQSLQGKVPGVQVVNTSGQPGAGAVVRIRGIGTLNNSNPLYVVDGVILSGVDINSVISPNDIETISVLKDASATAIYGARGANGVVLITTKKGTAIGESRISFSTYYGSQEIVKTVPLTNAREYAILANEIAKNETNNPNATGPFPNPDALGEGTDWQKEVYQSAPIQNYNLSFSGATEKISYTVSGDFFDQEGIIPGSIYERLTVRANTDYKIKDYLNIGHNLAFIKEKNDFSPGVVGNTYRADPTVIGFENGVYGNTSTRSSVANPLGQLEYENDNKAEREILVGNVYADLKFLKSFTLRSSFGVNILRGRSQSFVPAFFVSAQQQRDINSLGLSKVESSNWLWENTLTYNKEWNDLRLTLLGGITAQDNYFELLSASAQDFPFEDEALRFIPLSDLDSRTINNGATSFSMLSYLFRVNTTIFEKYLITATLRADGSSRFGANNRFGYFPSFALGWRITDEPFMENQTLFSNLKFRAGWGQTGNDQLGSDYASKALITSQEFAVFGVNETLYNGATITALSNPDLKWESTSQTNIGFEIGFLKNRLLAEIDYYVRTTNDILYAVPIPASVGLSAPPIVNAAEVRNQGVDLLLTWQDQKADFDYSITLTGSTVDNEVLKLSSGENEIRSGGLGFGGELGSITRAGIPIGSFYGYEIEGIIQTQEELDALNARARELTGSPSAYWRSSNTRPGDLKFRDLNNDGIINGSDRTILGSPIPDLIFGLNLEANYKGVALSINFAGQSGNEIINSKKMARFNTPNFERSYLDRWTGPGTSNSEPRVTNSGDNYLLTPRFIENGSFASLRNIQLSYDLPKSILQKIRLTKLQVYVAGSNLAYFTDYTGYNPEVFSDSPFNAGIDGGSYPISRLYTFGLKASF
ncbi:MAG: TonB-dependent receptor [Saprospiraceae bacterium]|nr:TonB-dependent receptor [Saprospiraceae bacterium]